MYVTIINEKSYEFVKQQGCIYGKFGEGKGQHKFCNYIKYFGDFTQFIISY